MRYSTRPGQCAQKHKMTKADMDGFRSPKPPLIEVYPSTDEKGVTRSNYTYTHDRLCKRHYLEAFAEVYPGAELPEI